jgi:putative DNA methylase
MRTERGSRARSLDSNALASSIVLVCRKRPDDAPTATRPEFLRALKRALPGALRLLQQGNIAPVDFAQAAIGPGMAVFSGYARVLESDGSSLPVRTALQLINQVLDEVLTEQEGDFDGDTRWALAWYEQHGYDEAEYGVAETLSKAKNTSVAGLVEAGILVAGRGRVRLKRRDELDALWDPATDARRTVWEVTQHLIRAQESHGETAAAALVARVGAEADAARDLAYRLYALCERKGRAAEALAYNALVTAWPELTRLAAASGAAGTAAPQGTLRGVT